MPQQAACVLACRAKQQLWQLTAAACHRRSQYCVGGVQPLECIHNACLRARAIHACTRATCGGCGRPAPVCRQRVRSRGSAAGSWELGAAALACRHSMCRSYFDSIDIIVTPLDSSSLVLSSACLSAGAGAGACLSASLSRLGCAGGTACTPAQVQRRYCIYLSGATPSTTRIRTNPPAICMFDCARFIEYLRQAVNVTTCEFRLSPISPPPSLSPPLTKRTV